MEYRERSAEIVKIGGINSFEMGEVTKKKAGGGKTDSEMEFGKRKNA